MHETDLVVEIVNLAREQMLLHNAREVKHVGLRVGELSCVAPEALTFAFSEAIKDTELENATLAIEKVAATARCSEHGVVRLELSKGLICPVCQTLIPDVMTGEELELDTLELI
ncbi:MAG: hydrogenase maturation nickel metallochaperone HypA [Trueperaceae bacterium]